MMTQIPTEAKIVLTGGKDFWHTHAVEEAGLPQVVLTDGPHGVRLQDGEAAELGLRQAIPATCFPPAVALASSWDPALVEQVGQALGEECQALGVGILLGPGMNIKRSPLCGRNFEYFSEDPLLSGAMAAGMIEGVQSQGVGTSVKHFAANNQETDRQRRDSQIDERTLREIYLRGFGKAIRQAKPWTVMCSYNRLNGTYASENHWLLTDILRGEWGYEGFVMSDWGAVHDRVTSLIAGLDLEMPVNDDHERATTRALAAGAIDPEVIDQAYARIEAVLRKVVDGSRGADDGAGFDVIAHHDLARQVAEQSIVLLTNDGVLPLERDVKVGVIGEFARTPRYQGAGSSRVNPTRLDNALASIEAIVGHEVPFAPGFITATGQTLPPDAHDQAVALASEVEVAVVFLGLGEDHESEGFDRTTMDLPSEQLALVDDILAVNRNVVVVLANGAAVLLPFGDRVRAVVEGWLPGQAGGAALAKVVYGLVNPSGKLAETIPLRLQDVPSHVHFPGDRTGVRYGEGLFAGYRGYDATQTPVAFPFGHGLSYTSFAYSGLTVTPVAGRSSGESTVEAELVPPPTTAMNITVTVTNTGQRAGAEVVQVYVGLPASKVVRVPRELKGFAKVVLEPGQSVPVEITVSAEDLAYWSVAEQSWLVEGGEYVVMVGSSSRDLRLSQTVSLSGDEPWRPLTMESTLGEAMANPVFAQAVAQAQGGVFGEVGADSETVRMMIDSPLSVIAGFSSLGAQIQGLLDQVNATGGRPGPR
jgi:beta-glucosidase